MGNKSNESFFSNFVNLLFILFVYFHRTNAKNTLFWSLYKIFHISRCNFSNFHFNVAKKAIISLRSSAFLIPLNIIFVPGINCFGNCKYSFKVFSSHTTPFFLIASVDLNPGTAKFIIFYK